MGLLSRSTAPSLDNFIKCLMIKLMTIKNVSMPSNAKSGRTSSQPAKSSSAPPVLKVPTPLARRFYQICVSMVADSIEETGLTPLQWGVLAYLSKITGEPGIDQNNLAARLGVDRNNASLLVEGLVARGLVERNVNGADRRARQLKLATDGEKLFARLRPKNRAANERILAPLTPDERKLLLDLLVKVIEANWVHARPGAGRRKRGSASSDKAKEQGRM
jgi:DNA-binding MarR family transcriptional regulator